MVDPVIPVLYDDRRGQQQKAINLLLDNSPRLAPTPRKGARRKENGYVVDVDPDDGELTASFDGRSVTYGFGELDALVRAYAVTTP
jgi:hypothetical protein